jgi:hypothetical protein
VDFACGNPAPFRYIHRRAEDGTEVYFVANKHNQASEAVCSFRVGGRRPEFWWPESGRIERPAMYEQANGVTRVPVRLNQFGSLFVVFRANSAPEADRVASIARNGSVLPGGAGNIIQVSRGQAGAFEGLVWQAGQYRLRLAGGKERAVNTASLPDPLPIAGPWDVQFAPDWGAPPRAQLPELISWSEHSDPGVRYFSGRAAYTKQIQVPASMTGRNRALYLDLGEVQVIARVKLNGRDLGTLWRPPFLIDVSGVARGGANALEVTVVNLWPNRIIGDENLPDDCEWNAPAVRGPGGLGPGPGPTQAQPQRPALRQTLKAFPQWLLDGKPSPTGRFTFSIIKVWPKDAPLIRSGWIGPVWLRCAARISQGGAG